MDPSAWAGPVWSFITEASISIDDMERYRDEALFEPWATWTDGFDVPTNGALIGKGDTGSPETDIVHGDGQSLPMKYGIDAAAQSEATRHFDAPMDWTRHSISQLAQRTSVAVCTSRSTTPRLYTMGKLPT
jgi:hypothetical protein